jgi:hypothetical protein
MFRVTVAGETKTWYDFQWAIYDVVKRAMSKAPPLDFTIVHSAEKESE